MIHDKSTTTDNKYNVGIVSMLIPSEVRGKSHVIIDLANFLHWMDVPLSPETIFEAMQFMPSINKNLGVVSWGIPNTRGLPDIFTSVSAYRTWIERPT